MQNRGVEFVLAPNERLLWSGKAPPMPLALWLSASGTCFVAAAICAWGAVAFLQRNGFHPSLLMPVLGSLGLLVFGMGLWKDTLKSPFRSYALTNQRAVFLIGRDVEEQYLLSHMRFVKTMNVHQGRGNVVFAQKRYDGTPIYIGFMNIENPVEVEEVLRLAWYEAPYPAEWMR